MGNKTKEKDKKIYRGKIKIRLTDPSIPDSYVCEIFDSSLESEDEFSLNDCVKLSKSIKPKNYFEILMSKESRSSFNCIPLMANERIKEELKISKATLKESIMKKKNESKKRNKQALTKSLRIKKTNNFLGNNSSDKQNLTQIQKKFKGNTSSTKQESNVPIVTDFIDLENQQIIKLQDSPKVELKCPEKRSLNILSYFSKAKFPSENKLKNFQDIASIKKPTIEIQTLEILDTNVNEKRQKCSTLNNTDKENVKLAPLFQKTEKKTIDCAAQKARLNFLFGTQTTGLKKIENKSFEYLVNFPFISHVQQRDNSILWCKRNSLLNLSLKPENCSYNFINNKKFSFNSIQSNIFNNLLVDIKVETTKDFMSTLKSNYYNLNLSLIIDSLNEKKKKFLNYQKEVEKKSQNKQEECSYETLNNLWIDKYKPKSNEILGNNIVIKKLEKWLQAWKTFDKHIKMLFSSGKKEKETGNDSNDSDDFISSDEENFGIKKPSNVCILSGPNGCGKTALVFALANELDFSVVEVNASSKRTGKKVLSELHEATQSHKVHLINLFQNGTCEKVFKKNNLKKKKGRKKNEPKIFNESNDSKISLILIEDADIIFEEHDEGFVSAIGLLVQSSKRPLIFLTNDPHCLYLENFKNNEYLELKMQYPDSYNSCALLNVMSSLEGGCISKEALLQLISQNGFDLRKSILELQFWVQSDKTPFHLQQPFDLGKLWWGLTKFLYCQEIKPLLKPKVRKRKRLNDFCDSSNEDDAAVKKLKLNNDNSVALTQNDCSITLVKPNFNLASYHEVLDAVSLLDGFLLPQSLEPVPCFEFKPADSLSLEESMEEVNYSTRFLSTILSEEIFNLSMQNFTAKYKEKGDRKKSLGFMHPSWEEIRWRKSQEKASNEISVLISPHNGRDQRSMHLDYLPTLRNICRMEKDRAAVKNKRTNRFKHYLYNLGFEISDENININCEIFQT